MANRRRVSPAVEFADNAIAPAPQGQLGLGAAYFAANGDKDGSVFIKQAFIRFKGAATKPTA